MAIADGGGPRDGDSERTSVTSVPGVVNLSRLQRILTTIRQSPESVLLRRGRAVSVYEIDNFFKLDLDRVLISMPEYAVFAAMTYNDHDGEEMVVDGQSTPVPLGWEYRTDFPSADELRTLSKRSVAGFYYEIWYSQSRAELVIAFRGTDGNFGDWFANLRWVTRFVPGVDDHYDLVVKGIDCVVAHAYTTFNRPIRITAVGHSLGGGLAQHAAQSHTDIGYVCAFNSSPVSGLFSIDQTRRSIASRGTLIARIFEHGEVLAYVRFTLRKLWKIPIKDPEIVEVRFNFERASDFIREHSMLRLAANIWRVARKSTLLNK